MFCRESIPKSSVGWPARVAGHVSARKEMALEKGKEESLEPTLTTEQYLSKGELYSH